LKKRLAEKVAIMKKLRVMTVIGTRPEIIRLSRVMVALDKAVEQVIVHTGQNYDYELNQVFFDDLELRKPDYFLDAAGKTACETVGNIIAKADALMEEVKPDALLVLGDTNSCLVAYPAKRRKIPVFHMEAGNRCFDQRVPEEINRKVIDHLADINLPYSTIARDYLLREGLPPDRVIKTGSPMKEVLTHYMTKVEKSKVLETLDLVLKCEPASLEATPSQGSSKVLKCNTDDIIKSLKEQAVKPYFLVSAHREENIDLLGRFEKLANVLNKLAETYGFPVIVTTHPRTRKRMESSGIKFSELVQFHKPFGLTDYLALQLSAKAILSDSGTVTEESSILDLPALNIRDAHERPEGMEEGVVMMTGLDWAVIKTALDVLMEGSRKQRKIVSDYDVDNVSDKVVCAILSYTSYVNRVVWQK
jgi:UDP-N-acetylglucosamine 2-epimerase (non-hydrolysing)